MLDEVYLGPHAMFLIEGSQFTGVIYVGWSIFGTTCHVPYRGIPVYSGYLYGKK